MATAEALRDENKNTDFHFPLERNEVFFGGLPLRVVILSPTPNSGSKISLDAINLIAAETANIVKTNTDGLADFMEHIDKSLIAKELPRDEHNRAYEQTKQAYNSETKPVVILPLNDTPSQKYKFPDQEIQAEVDNLLVIGGEDNAAKISRKDRFGKLTKSGFADRVNGEVLNKYLQSAGVISAQIQTLVQGDIDKIIKSFQARYYNYSSVESTLNSMKEETTHPSFTGRGVVSTVDSSWSDIFQDIAEIGGLNSYFIVDCISQLQLPPVTGSKMYGVLSAALAEIAIGLVWNYRIQHPEVSKRKHRNVFVFLPVSINSVDIQSILNDENFKGYFKDLEQINKHLNPPTADQEDKKQKQRRRFL